MEETACNEMSTSRKKTSDRNRRRGSDSDSPSIGHKKKCKKIRSRSSSDEDSRKKHKKSKKKKKRARKSSSSDEWVEKDETSKKKLGEKDDWLNSLPTFSSNKEPKTNRDGNKCITDAPGQTSRELNPYWKNGGTGLPEEEKDLGLTSSTIGDRGLEWYERALKRAEETAEKEGRSLADVVSERWGSLEKLTQLISQAKSENEQRRNRGHDKRRGFRKPGEEYGREYVDRRDDKRKEWRKPSKENERRPDRSPVKEEVKMSSSKLADEKPVSKTEILTEEELNTLAAKMVKAEILGKTDVVERLKKQLSEARAAREENANTVILTQINKQGVNVPVEKPLLREPAGGRRKNKRMETHSGGQRMRYFADDDGRDLKDMFKQEKLSTGDDDKDLFLKMATCRAGKDEDEEDAAFADAARICEASGKIQKRQHDRAVHESQQQKKILDGCEWCLENSQRSKHLVVSIGETCYLCLPAEESLTPLHCLLAPIEHIPCGTQLDENVWEEMHRFRRAVTAMASELDQDVFFFEQARGLKYYPHMVLHCVVLDKEIGNMAPIYFKKALLESESEWSDNKKVVDIKGPDVRRSVPKGLPYFAVEFPPQGGFAHVIEDEKLFPTNFAHSVVGGMLDLDHRIWRKAHKTTHAAQREKALAFAKSFAKHDFNRKGKTRSSSSSSD